MNRLVSTIKKNVSHKAVCGKAINGNMFLALALEYAETLSAPTQSSSSLTLPGNKASVAGSLLTLFTAFSRVSEEETMRIFDLVYQQFQNDINDQVCEETMPLGTVQLEKIFKKANVKYKTMLKTSMSEIATFEEVLLQADLLEHKMKDMFETKRQENYSAGYFFTVGLLQQLKEQYFPPD